jgi:hypothetical protein
MNAKHVVWLGLLAAVGFGCQVSSSEGLADPTVEEASESLTRDEPECSKNSDCHVEADYCTGCDCVALGPEQQLDECPGPGVQCLVDPCRGRTAICEKNVCVIE